MKESGIRDTRQCSERQGGVVLSARRGGRGGVGGFLGTKVYEYVVMKILC